MNELHIMNGGSHGPYVDYLDLSEYSHVSNEAVESTAYIDVALRSRLVYTTRDEHILMKVRSRGITGLIRPITQDWIDA